MPLFDPKTFTYDQLNSLNNVEGKSLTQTNTPEQIKTAQSMTMTPERLTSQEQPMPIEPIQPTPLYDTTALEQQIQASYAPTSQEQQISSASSDLTNIYNQLIGKTGDTAKLQESTGFTQIQKTQDDLLSQLNTLVAERKAIPLQLQEKSGGITTGVLGAMTESELRKNAIAALGVSALIDATKGQLDSAQRKIDNAITQKYGPLEAKQAMLLKQLELIKNDPLTTLQEKERADKQIALQNQKTAMIEQQKSDAKEIWNIGLSALKFGADAQTVQKIQSAKTPKEAILIATPFMQDPAAKLELEAKKLDLAIKSSQLAKLRAPTGGATVTAATAKDIAAKKALIPTLQDKVSLIDSLVKSKGLKSSVGPTPITRTAFTAGLTGAKQDFIAGVQQLISQDTLNTLLNLKAQGGTLGALSEGEGRLLQSAASKIGSWAIKNKNGEVTGYNASESSFKKELEQIKTLTNRAIANAQESVLSVDESAALDEYFGSASGEVAPENYFQ